MGLQPLGQVVGDARVERAVGAAEDVDEPAGLGVLLDDCRVLDYAVNATVAVATIS